jgi:hypothetical protein
MQRGRLMLADGSTASCDYEFSSSRGRSLRLPELMFTAHGQTLHGAMLELENGERKTIIVSMGPKVGEATFTVDK